MRRAEVDDTLFGHLTWRRVLAISLMAPVLWAVLFDDQLAANAVWTSSAVLQAEVVAIAIRRYQPVPTAPWMAVGAMCSIAAVERVVVYLHEHGPLGTDAFTYLSLVTLGLQCLCVGIGLVTFGRPSAPTRISSHPYLVFGGLAVVGTEWMTFRDIRPGSTLPGTTLLTLVVVLVFGVVALHEFQLRHTEGTPSRAFLAAAVFLGSVGFFLEPFDTLTKDGHGVVRWFTALALSLVGAAAMHPRMAESAPLGSSLQRLARPGPAGLSVTLVVLPGFLVALYAPNASSSPAAIAFILFAFIAIIALVMALADARIEAAHDRALADRRRAPLETLMRLADGSVQTTGGAMTVAELSDLVDLSGDPELSRLAPRTTARRATNGRSRADELERSLAMRPWLTQMTLALQPIVRSSDRALVGHEALIRWHHPMLGDVSPGEFIPIAEATGDIIEIGRWTASAVADIKAGSQASWAEVDVVEPYLGFNISAIELAQPGFATGLARLFEDAGADADGIVIELTETAQLSDPEGAKNSLMVLKDAGFEVALDDFGAGEANLARLGQMEFDFVKIDRTLITGTDTPEGRRLLQATAALARSLGLKAIAEGVETDLHLAAVNSCGIPLVQGYLVGRPAAAADIDLRHPQV